MSFSSRGSFDLQARSRVSIEPATNVGPVCESWGDEATSPLEWTNELEDLGPCLLVGSVHEELVRNDSGQVGRREQRNEGAPELVAPLLRTHCVEIDVGVEEVLQR